MKLANDVLLEIVEIVRDGLVNSKDISQALRDLDLEVDDPNLPATQPVIVLSSQYKRERGR